MLHASGSSEWKPPRTFDVEWSPQPSMGQATASASTRELGLGLGGYGTLEGLLKLDL